MTKGQRGAASREVRTLFDLGVIGDLTDGQLLERFATRDGEASELAFAALVERHGPMVLRVCRGVLHDHQDELDAFQATFLVLVRRAGSLWVRDSLGPWLHQVAYRTASCIRSAAARRKRHEQKAGTTAAQSLDPGTREDFEAVISEEVGRLSGRYRAAVVLCLLEGLTHEQAARQLGVPVGTVQSRLARGRERLRDRLTRRGLDPRPGALAALPSGAATSGAVPGSLVEATIRAAVGITVEGAATSGFVSPAVASLIETVLRSMFMTKIRMVACGLLIIGGVVAAGAGVLAQQEIDKKPGTLTGQVQEKVAVPQTTTRTIEVKTTKTNQGDQFKSDPGWRWLMRPQEVRLGHEFGQSAASGVMQVFADADGGALRFSFFLARAGPIPGNDDPRSYQIRLVVLDADGKRYMPKNKVNGTSGNETVHLVHVSSELDPHMLEPARAAFIGVEQFTPKAPIQPTP